MTALAPPSPLGRAVSDLGGIVTRLDECLADTDEPALVRVSCELAATTETVGAELGGSAAAAGSGFERLDASARAVGEALERYSACFVPAGRLVVSSARRLGPAALTPAELACFSAAQYQEPGFPYVPLSLDSVIPWVDGVDLVTGRAAWAPAELVYLGQVDSGPGPPIGYATSSGLACAAAVGDARERALLELLERDAFMLAWRTRRTLPHLDWRRDPQLRSLDERCFRRTGLAYHALDLSDEHGVPTVLGVCLGPTGSLAALGIGAAASTTLGDAWWRALAEAFAARTACRKLELADPGRRYADDGGDVHTFDDHIRFYASGDRAARAAFLWSGDATRDPRSVPDLPRDPEERLAGLVERAQRAGSRVVAVRKGHLDRAGVRVARSQPRPAPVSMTAPPTIQFASFAYGEGPGPALDDPAEAFHEAAKLRPGVAPRLPELSAPLVASMRRSSRRHPHRARVALPPSRAPRAALGRALARRRSVAPRPGSRLRLDDVGALARTYCWDAAHERRAVPSAGGLYPLELYVVARGVEGLAEGVYHVDPCEPSLEQLRSGPQDLAGILFPPAPDPAALLVITSVFWRTRCKYGVRGYRFALLEAGHLGQALVLLAAARGLDMLPLGGFFDAGLDELVGADGVDESVVYALAVGRGGR